MLDEPPTRPSHYVGVRAQSDRPDVFVGVDRDVHRVKCGLDSVEIAVRVREEFGEQVRRGCTTHERVTRTIDPAVAVNSVVRERVAVSWQRRVRVLAVEVNCVLEQGKRPGVLRLIHVHAVILRAMVYRPTAVVPVGLEPTTGSAARAERSAT
ncbi:hypothetical protein [Myceligenerans salitolerans]|uniref:Uncharacterized protein n=1 Tax=Myceligenerans salitolerans TaxID=1230528 RepID=A0ABS3IC37_9MICO|nr:hypothetical protein [Myceligenerans salitolerans]MBO0610602.1 hypothetical protein [Myceligenerans salitolerans]